MRLIAVSAALLAALAVGCADSDAGSPAAPSARLTITVYPQGREVAVSRRWTLTCGPVGGTLPGRRRACAQLAEARRPFRRVPATAVCTQIFGGPQEAVVSGQYRGSRVQAAFARSDGCQIARWNRVSRLFPVPLDTVRTDT